MRLALQVALLLVVWWVAQPKMATAQESEAATVARLRQQFDSQREKLERLQARVEALEKLLPERTQTQAPPEPQPEAKDAPAPLAQQISPSTQLYISGYADVTSVYRSTFTGTGIATAFGSIPLEKASEAQLGEFRGAANHSRLSMQVDTRLAGREVTSYAEMDFLGNAQPNVFTGSNSHTFRLRLYWAQFRGTNWELLGGQSWTLLAPNRVGISPRPYEIMHTHLPDPNYSVGLVWTRQATIRVTRHWNRLYMAAALENPEQTILDPQEAPADVRGLATRTNPGANVRPDSLVKIAYDARWAHLEAAAIGRSFRVHSGSTGRSAGAIGAGASVAGVIHAGSRLDLVSQNFISAGGGRYAQALVPDVVVRPDGQIVRITTYSMLQGVEAKATRDLNLYGYYGLVYGKRAVYQSSSGSFTGFGAPHGSTVDNRTVSQVSAGFRHTFWRGEGLSNLSYSLDYSYLIRRLWETSPAGGAGHTHMFYTSFRYNLP